MQFAQTWYGRAPAEAFINVIRSAFARVANASAAPFAANASAAPLAANAGYDSSTIASLSLNRAFYLRSARPSEMCFFRNASEFARTAGRSTGQWARIIQRSRPFAISSRQPCGRPEFVANAPMMAIEHDATQLGQIPPPLKAEGYQLIGVAQPALRELRPRPFSRLAAAWPDGVSHARRGRGRGAGSARYRSLKIIVKRAGVKPP